MLTAATLGATALLALTGGSLNEPSQLRALDPATLEPVGASVRLPSAALGLAWTRSGAILAVVAKPVATGQPVRIVDVRRLRTVATIGVGDSDVCGLTFRGRTLVALAADRPCYWTGGRFSIVRFDVAARRIARVIPVQGLRSAFPTNLAFGGGFAFVGRAGGNVDSIDLASGAVVRHAPKRSLAKGEGIVPLRWLGRHQLAVGGRVLDVRSWRARLFEPGAAGVVPAGDELVVYGPRGLGVYTRSGRLRYRAIDDAVTVVRVHGRFAYARTPVGTSVIDLRARRVVATVGDPSIVWTLLG